MTDRDCAASEWSVPTLLDPTDSSVIIRSPSIASGPAVTVVAGNSIASIDMRVVGQAPLTVYQIGEGSLGKPPGPWTFAHPRVAITDSNVVHLLWGEGAPVSRPLSGVEWPPRVTSIWHARREGDTWSTPVKLATAREFDWLGQLLAQIEASSRGQLFVAVVATRESGSPFPVFFHYVGGEWRAGSILDVPAVNYVAGTVVGSTLLMGSISSPNGEGGPSLILLQRSADGGVAWGAPEVVATVANGVQASELRALASTDGVIHLLWMENEAGASTALASATSSNGGLAWTHERVLLGAGLGSHLSAVIARDLTVHALVRRVIPGRASVHVSHLRRNGIWHVSESAFPTVRPVSQSIGEASDGQLMAVLLAAPMEAPASTSLQTFVSTWVCGR